MTDYFFSVCFSIQLWFYGTGSLFELIIMLKKKNEAVANETLSRWSWKVDKISGDIFVNKSISYDKIPNSTG